jgi:hypothetical protein
MKAGPPSDSTLDMFADSASGEDEVPSGPRMFEPADTSGLQDAAQDPSVPDADAYEVAPEAPAGSDSEAPTFDEATDAPDPYEYRDDGTAVSWAESDRVPEWAGEAPFKPEMVEGARPTPEPPKAETPKPKAEPPKPEPPKAEVPKPAPKPAPPKLAPGPPPQSTPAPAKSSPAPPAPKAPTPARPAPKAPTPAPKAESPAPKPESPAKPARPDRPTGKMKALEIDDIFQRAKKLKDEKKDP